MAHISAYLENEVLSDSCSRLSFQDSENSDLFLNIFFSMFMPNRKWRQKMEREVIEGEGLKGKRKDRE